MLFCQLQIYDSEVQQGCLPRVLKGKRSKGHFCELSSDMPPTQSWGMPFILDILNALSMVYFLSNEWININFGAAFNFVFPIYLQYSWLQLWTAPIYPKQGVILCHKSPGSLNHTPDTLLPFLITVVSLHLYSIREINGPGYSTQVDILLCGTWLKCHQCEGGAGCDRTGRGHMVMMDPPVAAIAWYENWKLSAAHFIYLWLCNRFKTGFSSGRYSRCHFFFSPGRLRNWNLLKASQTAITLNITLSLLCEVRRDLETWSSLSGSTTASAPRNFPTIEREMSWGLTSVSSVKLWTTSE